MQISDLTSNARVFTRKEGEPSAQGKCVVYWMQRSHRGVDNPALTLAVEIANRLKLPCVVYLAPIPFYPRANARHYACLQQGIPDIRRDVEARNVGFVLRRYPDHSLERFLQEVKPAVLVGDENPMREPSHWREVVASRVQVPFYTVDSDVVVPTRLFGKEYYAAHQFRKKQATYLEEFLVPDENPVAKYRWKPPSGLQQLADPTPETDITAGWDIDRSVAASEHFVGGTSEAMRLLKEFSECKLLNYASDRNQAHKDGTSRLSPYLHFGHISPITVAMAVQEAYAPQAQKDSFVNELLVWREVSINYVAYNRHYDSLEGADRWAKETLREHADDARPHVYTLKQFEESRTHDALWNAANNQMVRSGWMHNYLRMYWAKKILEWSANPKKAYEIAVELNDKYFLCGRDPNGYQGIAWAIAGKRDRPWFNRPVNGLVRPMSADGAKKKFDVDAYIAQWSDTGQIAMKY